MPCFPVGTETTCQLPNCILFPRHICCDLMDMYCQICQTCFKSFWTFPAVESHVHHRDYSSLVRSSAQGCWLCSDLLQSVHNTGRFKDIPLTSWKHHSFGHGQSTRHSIEVSQTSEDWPLVHFYARLISKNCPLLSSLEDASPITAPRTSTSEMLARNTGSKQTWSQVLRWLEQCCSLHGRDCNPVSAAAFVPTRLLNVSEAGKVRLQTKFFNGPVRYVTLSHRWGAASNEQSILTTSNLGPLQRNIDMETSSPTFKEAIEITRRLGVSFLWIDCLCIIQGDEQDWRHEASMMGTIYKNGFLNISAHSEDATEGCFQFRDPARVALFPIDNPDPSNDSERIFAMYSQRIWDKNVDQSSVNRRGWV
jgi:hypothetical protein